MENIEHVGDRVETGPVKFGNDWAGLFIRGDDSFYLAHIIEEIERNELRLNPFEYEFLFRLKAIIENDVRGK